MTSSKVLLSFVVAALCLMSSGVVSAQTAKEEVRIQFEWSTNGKIVARPILRMLVGDEAKIDLPGSPTLAVSPTRIGPDNVEVILKRVGADSAWTLRLGLRGLEARSAPITLGANSYNLRVSLLPLQ